MMNSSEEIIFRPIGIIHSDHHDTMQVPRQPIFARGCKGVAELFPEYEEGLKDIEGFSHLHLIFYFHQAEKASLIVKPFVGDRLRGVFATRAPHRPNHLGLSLVRLIRREGHRLYLDEVDILDGTPLLDIKPFVASYDNRNEAREGWLENLAVEAQKTSAE
jgi:tRNA-Thr(GGU) m(6)t(6)A37 methyltransferase TsaA